MDEQVDYTAISWQDLLDVRQRVNREKYPEAAVAIDAEVQRRLQQLVPELDLNAGDLAEMMEPASTHHMALGYLAAALVGAVFNTALVFLCHWCLVPALLADGQYSMIVWFTLPVGGTLGALAYHLLPRAVHSPLLNDWRMWFVLVIAGGTALLMLTPGDPSILAGLPFWLMPLAVGIEAFLAFCTGATNETTHG